MAETGIIRRIDDLGRIVIPREMMKSLGWRTGDPLVFYTLEDGVVLKRHNYAATLLELVQRMTEQLDEAPELGQRLAVLSKLQEIERLLKKTEGEEP